MGMGCESSDPVAAAAAASTPAQAGSVIAFPQRQPAHVSTPLRFDTIKSIKRFSRVGHASSPSTYLLTTTQIARLLKTCAVTQRRGGSSPQMSINLTGRIKAHYPAFSRFRWLRAPVGTKSRVQREFLVPENASLEVRVATNAILFRPSDVVGQISTIVHWYRDQQIEIASTYRVPRKPLSLFENDAMLSVPRSPELWSPLGIGSQI